ILDRYNRAELLPLTGPRLIVLEQALVHAGAEQKGEARRGGIGFTEPSRIADPGDLHITSGRYVCLANTGEARGRLALLNVEQLIERLLQTLTLRHRHAGALL